MGFTSLTNLLVSPQLTCKNPDLQRKRLFHRNANNHKLLHPKELNQVQADNLNFVFTSQVVSFHSLTRQSSCTDAHTGWGVSHEWFVCVWGKLELLPGVSASSHFLKISEHTHQLSLPLWRSWEYSMKETLFRKEKMTKTSLLLSCTDFTLSFKTPPQGFKNDALRW